MKRHLIGMLLLGALTAGAATLTFPPTATVKGGEILLGEVAEITDAGDGLARLQSIVLGAAPYPGQTRTLTPAMIRVRLRQFGQNPDALVITCPATVQITRQSTSVPGETLVATAQAWLQGQLTAAEGEKLELMPVTRPAAVTVPDGTLAISCDPAGTPVGTLRHVMVMVTVEHRQVWRGLISFRLQRSAEVLVARTALARG
ncbi:MAG TPA: hypothetical protein PK794_12495, partial [Armatimonadota bacterium]|nr:hypothetical protein [Armatimonadota bacterium]